MQRLLYRQIAATSPFTLERPITHQKLAFRGKAATSSSLAVPLQRLREKGMWVKGFEPFLVPLRSGQTH